MSVTAKDLLDFDAVSYCRSWACCVPEFAEILERLRNGNVPRTDNYELINVSSGKYVYRCKDGGFDFACKMQENSKQIRYLFRPSLPLREAQHYQWLQGMIPVPRVLAVGEIRKNLILQKSFLVTEFIDDTRDGRVFMKTGPMRSGFEDLRHAYAQRQLQLLAKLHDNGLFHKAFHPRNLLFRGKTPETLEVFWIDIARMRRAGRSPRREAVMDLHTFFRDMKLSEDETKELLGDYLKAVGHKLFTGPDELLEELIGFKRRIFSRKLYRLFE